LTVVTLTTIFISLPVRPFIVTSSLVKSKASEVTVPIPPPL